MPGMVRPRIMVLGGGFGGLESAFYLSKRLGPRAGITLVSDRDRFLFKPNTIYIPFGLDPEKLMLPLDRPTKRRDIRFIRGAAREIDPFYGTVRVDGMTLGYDFLVVATGAGMRPAEVPGLGEYARTIWTVDEMLKLRGGIAQVAERARAGEWQRVLFLVPPNNKCSGPLYELAFMLDTWLRRQRVREKVAIVWTTYERGYIQAFGPRLNEYVTAEFLRRGIGGLREHAVDRVEQREVVYTNGQRLPFDLLVSFPPYVAATPFPGLPQDERGFLQTELTTRQLARHPDIYAVGDAGDFPVKQAFLALLQADAAAEHLSARILGTQPAALFEPTSLCVMEQLDQATFAQVPLRLTGDPTRPMEVRPDANGAYRVGTSPAWRLGKKLLGLYLPWRFGAGNPFHAGLPWKAMDAGLRLMSRTLAA